MYIIFIVLFITFVEFCFFYPFFHCPFLISSMHKKGCVIITIFCHGMAYVFIWIITISFCLLEVKIKE